MSATSNRPGPDFATQAKLDRLQRQLDRATEILQEVSHAQDLGRLLRLLDQVDSFLETVDNQRLSPDDPRYVDQSPQATAMRAFRRAP